MPNINISEQVYNEWESFYRKHNPVEYPTFKNFTEKKMLQIMEIHNK